MAYYFAEDLSWRAHIAGSGVPLLGFCSSILEVLVAILMRRPRIPEALDPNPCRPSSARAQAVPYLMVQESVVSIYK